MKATPTIEFTFESPCSGQLENLLALDVEDDAAPHAAATRSHLSHCARCRAFRDSLKTQNRLVKRWYAENPVPERRVQRPSQREDLGLTPWLNDALKVRSERALAMDLWRCAAAVYRMDPEVDRKTVFEDAVVRKSPPAAIEIAVNSMLRQWTSGSWGPMRRESSPSPVTEQALALVGDVESTGRLPVVSRLLALSDQIVTRPIADSLLLQAEIDWHDRVGARATSLLEAAYRLAARPIHRLHALNNLAIWSFDHAQIAEAKDLAMRAIDTTSESVLARMNLAIWSLALGNSHLGESLLSSAIRATDRLAFPSTILRVGSMIVALEAVLGRTPGELSFILDRVRTRIAGGRLHGYRAFDGMRNPS